ncbi:unnamed protein product [Adineta steineri]|uniref:Uncharacterized protein n=1 Tax=Adineta steineri TaxID=433720 RepID=A0A819EW65_9BILA|nr:unnamed protein product [Adineta steineri]
MNKYHNKNYEILRAEMPPKAEFKPKPSAKSEKNKPKGGKAKDEKRAAEKAKKEAKLGGGPIQFGAKK